MIIRKSQYDAMRWPVEETFEKHLARFLYEQFPETALTDETQFRDQIRAQIKASRSYGLETEQQIAAYVVSAWALGADFDTRFPAAQQVLSTASLPSEEKMKWLEGWTHALFELLEEKG